MHKITLALCGAYLASLAVIVVLFQQHAAGMLRLRAAGLLARDVAQLSVWALLLETYDLGPPFSDFGVSVNDTTGLINVCADSIDSLSHALNSHTSSLGGSSRATVGAAFSTPNVPLMEWVPTADDATSGFYRAFNGTLWDGLRRLLEAARDLGGRGPMAGANSTSAQFRYVVDNGPSELFSSLLAVQKMETDMRIAYLRIIESAMLAILVINAAAGAVAAVVFYGLLKGATPSIDVESGCAPLLHLLLLPCCYRH